MPNAANSVNSTSSRTFRSNCPRRACRRTSSRCASNRIRLDPAAVRTPPPPLQRAANSTGTANRILSEFSNCSSSSNSRRSPGRSANPMSMTWSPPGANRRRPPAGSSSPFAEAFMAEMPSELISWVCNSTRLAEADATPVSLSSAGQVFSSVRYAAALTDDGVGALTTASRATISHPATAPAQPAEMTAATR